MSIHNVCNGKILSSNTPKLYNLTRNQLGSGEINSVFHKYDKDDDGKLNSCNKNGINELDAFRDAYKSKELNVTGQSNDSTMGNLAELEKKGMNPLKIMYDGVKKFLNGEKSTDVIYRNGESVEANGVLEHNEQGQVGNCWMLSELNAGKNTDFGKEAVKGAIAKNPDGSYSVNLKGVNKSYNFTVEEIQSAIDSEKYSEGDLDYLLLEMAFERHYDEALKQVPESDIENMKEYGRELPSRSIEGEGIVVPKTELHLEFDDLPEEVSIQNRKGGYNDKDLYGLLGKETYRVSVDFSEKMFKDNELTEDLLSLKKDHPQSVAITFGSSYNIETGEDLDGGHEYSIENVNEQEGGTIEVDVRNPWDNSKSISKTSDEVTYFSDLTLNLITDDKSIAEKTNEIKRDSYHRIFKQKFYDENSTPNDIIIREDLDNNGKKEVITNCGGMKNYMNKYLDKWRKDPDMNELTENDFSTITENTYKDTFGFSEVDAKDCVAHPEKLKEYCEKYGYEY